MLLPPGVILPSEFPLELPSREPPEFAPELPPEFASELAPVFEPVLPPVLPMFPIWFPPVSPVPPLAMSGIDSPQVRSRTDLRLYFFDNLHNSSFPDPDPEVLSAFPPSDPGDPFPATILVSDESAPDQKDPELLPVLLVPDVPGSDPEEIPEDIPVSISFQNPFELSESLFNSVSEPGTSSPKPLSPSAIPIPELLSVSQLDDLTLCFLRS